MFRYKADIASRELEHKNNKLSGLPSVDNYKYKKDTMGQIKEPWLNSKETMDNRKPRGYGSSRRSSRQDLHQSEYDEESIIDNHSSAASSKENVKVNVLYKGMTYRIRGFKICCSIISAVVMLLTAATILGVWIILGANEDGTYYFPWASRSNTSQISDPVSRAEIPFLPTMRNNIITQVADIKYEIPSVEVEETLGHFQAVRPQPTSSSTSTSVSSTSDYYYDENVYADYTDYAEDPNIQHSILHSSFINVPRGYVDEYGKDYVYTDKYYGSNDFRVHYADSNPLQDKDEVSKVSPPDNAFKPSQLIPQPVETLPEVIVVDNSGQEIIQETLPPKLNEENIPNPTRIITNAHMNNFNNYDHETPDVITGRPIDVNEKDETVPYDYVDYNIPNDRQQLLSYDVLTSEIKNNPMISDAIVESGIYFDTGNPILQDQYLPDYQSEEDPHRKLFSGNYDPSQVILDDNHGELPYFEMDEPKKTIEVYTERSLPPTFIRTDEFLGQNAGSNIQSMTVEPTNLSRQILRQQVLANQRHNFQNFRRYHPMNGKTHNTNDPSAELSPTRHPISPPPLLREPDEDMHIAESITYPSVVRPNGSPPFNNNFRMRNILKNKNVNNRRRNRPPHRQQSAAGNTFLSSLNDMYEYSRKLATSLLSFPTKPNLAVVNTTGEFLKNSFSLLRDYDNVFQSLPRVLTEPLRTINLPSADQIDNLDPFELSLMTWTFIDFWEFLIEKVGSLSKQDLRLLEMRLERLRQQKDSTLARAFMTSASDETSDADEIEGRNIRERIKLNLAALNLNNTEHNNSSNTETDDKKPFEMFTEVWDPLGIFNDQERVEFLQYAMKTLFNFGKVYMKSDYAMDCMMLLFCKDINSKTKSGGLDSVAAKLKSVGLKVLVDREGREVDTVSSVWQALTHWEPLSCDSMFPKCDGSKALEIVNEVANAARRR